MRAGALLAASARRRLGSVILLAATTAATVAALGTFAAAAFSPSFAAIADYRVYVRRAFEGASVAMALFVVLSGWFLSEHYLAGRRRELSLWLLAGMRRRDALAELSLELAAALGCGLAGGLAAGALLSRFFSLVLGALMKLGSPPELPYALAPIAACAATVLLQYGLAVAKAWSEISHSSISALLRSEREPEGAPARTGARAALGAALIAASYAGAWLSRGMLAEILILPLLAGAVIGTFLAFDALVPALAQALRSRAASCSTPRSPPRSTPRSTRMASRRLSAAALFAAAQIAFRSRKNARLLALCSVLVGMATSAAGTVAAIAQRLAVEGAYGQDALFGALLFMGAFLACAFALSATVLLMSRAASDARDDAERRSALRELGSSRAVEGRVLAMQNACYFGLPAVFGIAHSAAALTMLRTFSDYPTIGPALAADCATAAILATAAAASTARQLEDAKASRR